MVLYILEIEPRYEKTGFQISCAVTAQLISSFVFDIRIVRSLYYRNPKFQASSHLLWLYSPVCVGTGLKPRRPVFSQRGSINICFGDSFALCACRQYLAKFHLLGESCSLKRMMSICNILKLFVRLSLVSRAEFLLECATGHCLSFTYFRMYKPLPIAHIFMLLYQYTKQRICFYFENNCNGFMFMSSVSYDRYHL